MSIPSFLHPFIVPVMSFVFKQKAASRIGTCLGLFSNEEFDMLLTKDFDVINNVLGDQKFLFGDQLSNADFSVFGHLAAVYFLPFSSRPKELLNTDYPKVVEYLERIRDQIYPTDFEKTKKH